MITSFFNNLFSLCFHTRSKKPLLFKSFTGLTVQEFDNIYKEIAKKYEKHEIQRLSKRKGGKNRERKFGAGRPFNLDVKK